MQDSPAQRGLFGKSLYFCHQVMLDLCLDLQGTRNIYTVYVLAQVGYLLAAYQPKFSLHLSQRHPQLAPGAPFLGLAPQRAHLGAAIAPGIGRKIDFII